MLEKIEGIIIREKEYRETDKLVWMYTRERGKVSLIAKGAKRANSRLAACTQPFTYGVYVFSPSKGLSTLKSGDILNNFSGIKKNLLNTAYVAYMCELVDKCIQEHELQPYVYEWLFQLLHLVDDGNDPEILTRIFEMKMTEVLGIQPELHQCVHCARNELLTAFSNHEGGVVCSYCLTRVKDSRVVSVAVIKLLQLFSVIQIKQIGRIRIKDENRKQLNHILTQYFEIHSGLFIKSRKFIEQLDFLQES